MKNTLGPLGVKVIIESKFTSILEDQTMIGAFIKDGTPMDSHELQLSISRVAFCNFYISSSILCNGKDL
jgi:hypothetical protein